MGREGTPKPNYEILAFITMDKEKVLAGNPLSLFARNEKEAEALTVDFAKAMKADVVQMGDYLVLKV